MLILTVKNILLAQFPVFPGHVFDKAVNQAFIYDGQIKPRKQFYGLIQENKDIFYVSQQSSWCFFSFSSKFGRKLGKKFPH